MSFVNKSKKKKNVDVTENNLYYFLMGKSGVRNSKRKKKDNPIRFSDWLQTGVIINPRCSVHLAACVRDRRVARALTWATCRRRTLRNRNATNPSTRPVPLGRCTPRARVPCRPPSRRSTCRRRQSRTGHRSPVSCWWWQCRWPR